MSSPIKPLGQRAVLELKTQESEGGITLAAETQKQFAKFYEVVATGPGCKNVKVGDEVVINRAAATDIKVKDRELTIIKEDEILGVL